MKLASERSANNGQDFSERLSRILTTLGYSSLWILMWEWRQWWSEPAFSLWVGVYGGNGLYCGRKANKVLVMTFMFIFFRTSCFLSRITNCYAEGVVTSSSVEMGEKRCLPLHFIHLWIPMECMWIKPEV